MDHQSQVEYLNTFLYPNNFYKRNDNSDTVDGCKSCPNTVPSCNCGDGQTCTQITRTCDKCAYIKCVGGSSRAPRNIGGIAGGIIGGIFFIALIIGFIIHSKKKHNKSNRLRRLENEEKEILAANSEDDYDPTFEDLEAQRINSEPYPEKRLSTSNISTPSTTFKDPKYKGRRASNYRNSALTFTSMASSALTRASNIIPVAYIPGVKVRSYSTLFINKSIKNDDLDDAASSRSTVFCSPISTMTAVKVTPRLVKTKVTNASSIKEEDEETSETESSTSTEKFKKNNPTLKTLTKREQMNKNRKSVPGLTHIIEGNSDDLNDLISLGDGDDDSFDAISQLNESRKRFYQISMTSTTEGTTDRIRPSSAITIESENPINPFDDKYGI